jgi:hypothetical protein
VPIAATASTVPKMCRNFLVSLDLVVGHRSIEAGVAAPADRAV